MHAVYFNLKNKDKYSKNLIEIISSQHNGFEHIIKLINIDHIYFWIYLVNKENQLTKPHSLYVNEENGIYDIRIISEPSEAFIYYRYNRIAFRANYQIKPVAHYV
jgi:hypothetical protein